MLASRKLPCGSLPTSEGDRNGGPDGARVSFVKCGGQKALKENL
jgi:hypothetical protein